MTKLRCMKCGKKVRFREGQETECPRCGSNEYIQVSTFEACATCYCVCAIVIVLTGFILLWVFA